MIVLFNPTAPAIYQSRFGNKYVPDANGAITVQNYEVPDLLAAGWYYYAEPANDTVLFGGLTYPAATFSILKEEGNIFRSVNAGATGFGGSGTGSVDNILGGIVLDASAFDIAGRGLAITAQGMTGATGNAKFWKLWINPTMSGQAVVGGVLTNAGTVTAAGSGALLLSSGSQTTNNGGWQLFGNLFKYGAAGSNTQYFQGNWIAGATHGGMASTIALTQSEAATMTIVVTGNGVAANDVVLQFLEMNAMN